MAVKPLPSQEVLRQLLDYDQVTGLLTWKRRDAIWFSGKSLAKGHSAAIWNRRFAGKVAFDTPNHNGYRYGSWFKQNFLAHRIIWKWWHGTEPPMIDHANGLKSDNRIANLRPADAAINSKNMPLPRHNTSGEIGIYHCSFTGRWRASFCSDRQVYRLGRFKTLAEAVAARDEAMANHGFHANHGRRN